MTTGISREVIGNEVYEGAQSVSHGKTASDERVQKGPASSADDDQQNEITLGWRTDGWPAGKAGKLTKPTYPGSLAKANEGEEQDRFRRT